VGLVQEPHESRVILPLVKHPLPGVPAIENVITISAGRNASRSRHAGESIRPPAPPPGRVEVEPCR
jgi:hypothetical protein